MKTIHITSQDDIVSRVAKQAFASKIGAKVVRIKTAGEIRYIKDQGPELREIPKDFEYNKKYIKPLSKTLWSLSCALGHLISAEDRFTKIRSVNISPDGKLGGKGYIQSVKDIRSRLSEAVEIISDTIDTISDEVKADHWKAQISQMSESEQDELEEIMDEAEDIISDPDGFEKKVDDALDE